MRRRPIELPTLALVNQRTDEALAEYIEVAVTRRARRKGLLGRDAIGEACALILAPCAAIHTMFMRFDIDAVFVDEDGCAVKIVRGMTPWRIAANVSAHAVVELASGTLSENDITIGDRLYLVAPTGDRVGLSVSGLRERLC
ncbi:MAG TPA: DUF192 domain-containing protein [Vicinamibacterales bacterium]|nr:DUF192 domain-containing protein [Vicinamibacterales bacterium]